MRDGRYRALRSFSLSGIETAPADGARAVEMPRSMEGIIRVSRGKNLAFSNRLCGHFWRVIRGALSSSNGTGRLHTWAHARARGRERGKNMGTDPRGIADLWSSHGETTTRDPR